ncbi:hypothetical protein [Gottfriedia solisilvae]|uniref:hypothetical protein n=1 Tax=Gottfriedia solisilvae TaxID=1516104 RepID=UPI003D2F0020
MKVSITIPALLLTPLTITLRNPSRVLVSFANLISTTLFGNKVADSTVKPFTT